MGAYGNADIQTPHLDRLARESVRFEKCFAQSPVCMPSRISTLAGQYPSSLGIPYQAVPVPEEWMTMPRYFGAKGYHCANIGKLHFLPHANRDHRIPHPDYGFDLLMVSDEPGAYEDDYRAWVRRQAPQELDKISLGQPPASRQWKGIMGIEDPITHPENRSPSTVLPFPGSDELTHSAFVGKNTIEFLENRQADPFLCIASFFAPHSPWVVPQKYLDLYDEASLSIPEFPPDWHPDPKGERPTEAELRRVRRGYYAMISEVDDYVGQILATLEKKNLRDNTIVVFVSDHGEWLGEHGRYGKGYPADDAVSRVPCLIRWPSSANIQPGPRDGLVESIDLLPTLMEACGIQIPPNLQGRSWLSELRTQFRGNDFALTEGEGWKALRTPTHRYLLHGNGREMLFDLQKDPGEYNDVAGAPENENVVHKMRHLLAVKLMEMERPRPRVWRY
jgi:arylsulfatase A-like enzyme